MGARLIQPDDASGRLAVHLCAKPVAIVTIAYVEAVIFRIPSKRLDAGIPERIGEGSHLCGRAKRIQGKGIDLGRIHTSGYTGYHIEITLTVTGQCSRFLFGAHVQGLVSKPTQVAGHCSCFLFGAQGKLSQVGIGASEFIDTDQVIVVCDTIQISILNVVAEILHPGIGGNSRRTHIAQIYKRCPVL